MYDKIMGPQLANLQKKGVLNVEEKAEWNKADIVPSSSSKKEKKEKKEKKDKKKGKKDKKDK